MTPLKNARHERFAQAIAAGKPDVEAYQAAGFKCSQEAASASASRLKKQPDVASRIAAINSAAAEQTTVSIVAVVKELAKLGFANVKNYGDLAFTGDLRELPDDVAAALKSVTVDHYTEGHGDDAQEVKRVRFEIFDKRGPLTDIIRHLGGFPAGPAKGSENAVRRDDERPVNVRSGLSELDLTRRIAFAIEKGARRAAAPAARRSASKPGRKVTFKSKPASKPASNAKAKP